MEKFQKEMNEQNAGLAAQNALLKKQLTYFEDIFAKSSLLGYDNMGGNINRNDLEVFQKNLLKKINARFTQEREQESLYKEDSLEIIPGSTNRHHDDDDDIDVISTGSQENHLNSLRLVRSRSNSSNYSGTGYLFLAIVFCMMCCSSLLTNTSSAFKQAAN
jgi:hypothetical protein